ncbi:MAG: hypothetical protein SOW36_01640 [Porphyromonas sp.]|uniref:hypothetical protein n=1 Tax=Porphyromonas sp. TaxID=1924944 RepID=UPI002A756C89|nr:hypothetical protein [Porphyromonas sp.]MDY3111330.1 hypothetical protein [Porphyromonas sp.]
MKKRVSYKDFQRRQKLAEADLVIAERTWQRELGYIKGLGIKKTIINEVKEQIAPRGSLLGCLLTPSTRKQRRKGSSLLSKLTGGPKQSTYSSLTQGEQEGATTHGATQRVLDTAMSLAKPILWTVGIGMAKGFLRKKFKPLRFFL